MNPNNQKTLLAFKKEYTNKIFKTNKGLNLKILDYRGVNDITVIFENGYTTITNLDCIRKGTIKNPLYPSVCNVGYFGVGIFTATILGKNTPEYEAWSGMIKRCYGEKKLEKYTSYIGCSVDEKWHNFQNFAKWHEENYNPEIMKDWQLDKDILVKNNKIYSPETCCFVPRDINNVIKTNKNKRGELPVGVSRRTINKKEMFRVSIATAVKKSNLGYFNTPEEAFQVYKTAKENYIKEVADKWCGLISKRVYQALMDYKIEITD